MKDMSAKYVAWLFTVGIVAFLIGHFSSFLCQRGSCKDCDNTQMSSQAHMQMMSSENKPVDTGPSSSMPGHAHKGSSRIDVSGEEAIPDLEIAMTEDAVSGWNLQISTTDFRFTPYNVGGDHVPGEGHAHIYINGEKRARIYGPWFHVDPLPKGRHDIEVTLNSNTHAEYFDGERRVSRKTIIFQR